jgi:DNA-binding response OmpR family regulator
MQKIFLLEDEPNFGAVMKSYLEINNFMVHWIKDGKEAIKEFELDRFDLCILDVMLPNVDGFTVGEQIRKINKDIPIVFLTAKTLKEDVIRGYKIGADDYITKPFDSEVLLFKIKAILSRNKKNLNKQKIEHFNIGSIRFNYPKRTILASGQSIKISPKESELLYLLCTHMGEVLSREEALLKIWGEDGYFTTRSMDVFITKLRKYLKSDNNISIENVHGSGFVLKVDK